MSRWRCQRIRHKSGQGVQEEIKFPEVILPQKVESFLGKISETITYRYVPLRCCGRPVMGSWIRQLFENMACCFVDRFAS
jgi:hypothetical protein